MAIADETIAITNDFRRVSMCANEIETEFRFAGSDDWQHDEEQKNTRSGEHSE